MPYFRAKDRDLAMLPDIDSLALFVQAAEWRSLTKAAEASHIGLAAASRRIALLEDRFKATLFERSPRGVELTAAGVSLLTHAKSMLMLMNQMQSAMMDHAVGRRGALRILANTSAMTEFLPNDLARFGKAHPDVSLVIEERWSVEIARAVMAAEADLGIVVEGIRTEGLDVFGYRSDRLALVVPPGHALAGTADVRFVDVLDHDVIALESGSSMMRLLAEQAVVAEKTLQLRVQVRSFEAVCRMVECGLGVGLLPFQAANALGKALGLVVRPLPEAWAQRRMLVCVKKDRPANSSLSKLLSHLAASPSASSP
jgi:DNA-binding transcriptional LysR family regulator